jgi:serpin B
VPRLFAAAPPANPVGMGSNEFGLDLFGRLGAEPGNVFISPFSLSVALAMTAAGARGTTLEQMVQVLHLPDDPTKTDAAFKTLIAAVNGAGVPAEKRGYQLRTANALWAQQGYPWRKEYKQRVANGYGAGLFDTDFQSNPAGSRTRINTWVEKETHDKIKDLLPARAITPMTRLVLTNAIYFKGDWATPFNKKGTREQPFTLADGTKKPIPLMHRAGAYKLYQDQDLQALELPYTGDQVSMVVLLPRKPDGLPALEKKLSAGTLKGWLGKLQRRSGVQVYLPKFKVETEYELNDPLKALGMKAAFMPERADFSGMSAGPEQLHISAVVHKAHADVNEEGTVAAAATGVVVATTSFVQPPVFRADHPFLFLIRHVPTGTVLFLGREENPGK